MSRTDQSIRCCAVDRKTGESFVFMSILDAAETMGVPYATVRKHVANDMVGRGRYLFMREERFDPERDYRDGLVLVNAATNRGKWFASARSAAGFIGTTHWRIRSRLDDGERFNVWGEEWLALRWPVRSES